MRSLSAVVFLVVMIGAIYWNTYSFQILFAMIGIGCMYEYIKLMKLIILENTFNKHKTTLLLILTGFLIYPFFLSVNMRSFLLTSAIVFMPLILIFALEMAFKKFDIHTIMASIGGIVYLAVPLSFISFLGNANNQNFDMEKWMVLAVLSLIWTNDTMAYIVGWLAGRTPFVPHISPKKTWEGIIGGMLFTAMAAYLLSLAFKRYHLIFEPWWAIGPAVSLLATLGDLAESMLKRAAGVKDSGQILPGHGGFLDRFDAMLFALPPVFGYLYWINLF